MSALPNASGLDGLINQVQNAAGQSAGGAGGSLFGSFSTSTLLIGLFAGLVGSAYFLYGKRSGNFSWLAAGIALWVVPLFVTSTLWLSLSCGALACIPFVASRYL